MGACAAATAAWVGPPEEPVEAGSIRERAAVASLTRKARMKTAMVALARRKLGLPSTAPRPGAPAFPCGQLLGWGAAALAGLAGAHQSRKWKGGAKALSKALGRLKANGDAEKVVEAVEAAPDDEKRAAKAVYRKLKASGEV